LCRNIAFIKDPDGYWIEILNVRHCLNAASARSMVTASRLTGSLLTPTRLSTAVLCCSAAEQLVRAGGD
jgi:hypothetical protein